MVINHENAFISTLIYYLFKRLSFTFKMVAPNNHQLLWAEHGIVSLATLPAKHLTGLGKYWPKYLLFAMFSSNTFGRPNLNGFSPYELVFGRKPKLIINLEIDPNVKVSGTFKEYYELLSKRLEYLQKLLFDFKMKNTY